MDDEISSREGGDPPNKREPVRRSRIRKLSGPTKVALGDLAFVLYQVTRLDVPSDTKWNMLAAKLLAWRAQYL